MVPPTSRNPLPGSLNEFHFVSLRGIDECYDATTAGGSRSVAQRVSLRRGFLCKLLQIFHFKCQVSEIRPDNYRPAGRKVTDLNFFIASLRLEENQCGT